MKNSSIFKPLAIRSVSLLGSVFVRGLMGSLDYMGAMYGKNVIPTLPNDGQKRIFLIWHEHILMPLYLFRNSNIAMLLSKHRDADILDSVAGMFGFGCVRGSTNRGGLKALKEMISISETMHLTITPDGPRGPRRKMAPGAVYLASKLQFPIVLVGCGYDRPYRVPSWDRFAIPRCGSKARIIGTDDIYIPEKLDREGLNYYTETIEKRLSLLNDFAEDWATSGETLKGEFQVLPGPKASIFHSFNPRPSERDA